MEPKSSRLFFLTLRHRSYSWREGSSGNNDGFNKLFSHLSASGSQGQKSCHLIHQTSWPVNCPHQPTAAGGAQNPPQWQSDVREGIRKLRLTSEEPISGRSKPSPEGQSPAGFSVWPGWKCIQWDRKPGRIGLSGHAWPLLYEDPDHFWHDHNMIFLV